MVIFVIGLPPPPHWKHPTPPRTDIRIRSPEGWNFGGGKSSDGSSAGAVIADEAAIEVGESKEPLLPLAGVGNRPRADCDTFTGSICMLP